MKLNKVMVIALAITGTLLLTMGLSTAHQQDQNSNSNSNSNMSRHSSNMNGGSTKQGMAADGKFMMMAAQGGMAEVEAARVALTRSSNDAVKQFAQHMIDDHTQNNTELMQVAAGKGVTLPAGPDAKHQAMMTKMQSLTGDAFDREYIKNSGVKDHEAMQKLMQKEIDGGKDADAKAYASKTLPAVQEHLRMARELSSSMMGGKGKSSSNMNSNMGGNTNGNSNRR